MQQVSSETEFVMGRERCLGFVSHFPNGGSERQKEIPNKQNPTQQCHVPTKKIGAIWKFSAHFLDSAVKYRTLCCKGMEIINVFEILK